MNVILILGTWYTEVNSFARENVSIKIGLHRVTGAKQSQPFQISRFSCYACGFYDTDQRYRGLRRDAIKHDVRRICRNQAKICTCASKLPDCLKQIISHASQIVCVHESQSLLQIYAVNNEPRITSVADAFSIQRDNSLIVIECAFRPQSADDSQSLHFLTTNKDTD